MTKLHSNVPTIKTSTFSTAHHNNCDTTVLNASKRDASGYYRYVAEPMAYDSIYTRDGRRIQIESHVIGRDC